MIFTEHRIKAELEAFIDWPTSDRSTVTTASCLIFAKVIAGMVEAELGKDAERWRKARDILTVEAVEYAQSEFLNFGLPPDESESAAVDAAIDAAMASTTR